MKRLFLSILAGLLANIILATAADHILHVTNVYPPYGQPMFNTGLVLLAFTYRALFIILCAYLTALIAKDKAGKALWILGIIGSVLWLIGAISFWNYAPAWYNIGGVVLGVPLTLLGGALYKFRVNANQKMILNGA